jgi:hypothetical protein
LLRDKIAHIQMNGSAHHRAAAVEKPAQTGRDRRPAARQIRFKSKE